MESSIYNPIFTKEESNLPFYISTIGTSYSEDYIYRPDGVDDYLFLYTEKGEGLVKIQDNMVQIPTNSLLIIPPHITHYYTTAGYEWRTHYITFNGWAVNQFFDIDTGVFKLPKEFSFMERFNNILKYHNTTKWAHKSSVLLYSLLLECNDFLLTNSSLAYKQQKQIKECINYINHNFMNSIELSTLAKICNVTKEHFCRTFKNYTNMRPFEYIKEIRIEKSKEFLLKYPRASIGEIGKMSGFQNNSYFSMTFRATVGVSPEDYRKRYTINK